MLTSTIIPFRFEPAAACDDVPAPPLNIIILHEDRGGRQAALELLREVLTEKSGESEVRPMAWRFDELRGSLMRARALEAAASGEIFVIAASCARPIPSHVIEWLGEAFQDRGFLLPSVTVVYDREEDVRHFGALAEALVRHEAETSGVPFVESEQLATVCLR